MQNKKRIPASENVAYTHWEMPDLTGVKRRIAQRLSEFDQQEKTQIEEEEVVEPALPSSEEIEALKEEARKEGYAAGFAEGNNAGQEEGRALGYQEGEKTGEETGFQSGYQRGLNQAEQEVDQQLARLQSLIERLQGPLAALDHEVESALLSLVDLVCRAILRREITLDRSFLAEVLQEAVAALPAGHQRLRIFLNPEDLNLAEAACEDLLEDYRLVGDPEVTLGGVKIETLQSLVDSTLENRYKKIIEKLLSGVYQPATTHSEPLAEQVLSTPDAAPLDEAAFSEPEVTEPPLTPTPEPVAQVSLQRAKAPRHEQPLAPPPKQKVEPAPEELVPEEPEPEEPEPEEPALEAEPELTSEPQQEEPLTETPADNSQAEEQKASEPQKENSEKVDEFLDEFATNDADPEFEEYLTDSTSGMQNNEVGSNINSANEEATIEEEETTWSPESVHDDRYLENVFEDTWLDDLQEPKNSDNPNG